MQTPHCVLLVSEKPKREENERLLTAGPEEAQPFS